MSISLFAIGFMVMLLFACIQLSMLSILNEALTMVMPLYLSGRCFWDFHLSWSKGGTRRKPAENGG